MLKHFLCLFAGLILTLASLGVPVQVDSHEGLKTVRLGLPFAFLVQDNSRYDPPSFPRKYDFESPWNSPFQFHGSRFAASVLVFTLMLEILTRLVSALVRSTRDS